LGFWCFGFWAFNIQEISMSSITGFPQSVPPKPAQAAGVAAQIESVCGNLDSLYADVNSLLAELQALQPPVKGKDESDSAFAARVSSFQKQVSDLNRRIDDCYRRIGMAQAKLRQLQNTDLPRAERADAEVLKKWFDDMAKAMESAAKALKEVKPKEKDEDDKTLRVEIQVQEKKIQVRGNDFQSVVRAFALVATVVGMPKVENPMTRMPHTPGSGLPPIDAA
jgi:chromosome segregation ATPase